MTQAPSPMPPIGQDPAPAAPAQGSRKMAGAALGLGIAAWIPCLGVITGIIGIILGILALVKRKAGQGMAIAGIAVGGFGILIGQAIGAVLVTILVPVVMMALDSSDRTVCKSNVDMIGRSIRSYRQEHNGKYPADLAELVSEGFLAEKAFRCPSASEGTARSLPYKYGGEITSYYFYLPPPAGAHPKTMVLCGYRGNHTDERTVLYVDRTVEFLKEEAFNRQLALPFNAAFGEALRKADPP